MTLPVTRAGEHGPDLVLVHGWGLHAGIWAPVMEPLAQWARVHAIDLPGHGRSALEAPFTLGSATDAVLAAVPRGAVWLGWSLGGQIALEAAARARGDVQGLILVCATPRFTRAPDWPHGIPSERLDTFADELERDWRETLVRFLSLQTRGTDAALEDLRALRASVFEHGTPSLDALRGALAVLREVDLRARLPQVQVPALLIAGERDALVPADAVRATAAAMPDAELEIMPGAGHAPFLTAAPAFAERVRAFVSGRMALG